MSMQGDVEVGKLVVFNEEVLGHGSQGTTVYRLVIVDACMGSGGRVHGEWGQGAWGVGVGCMGKWGWGAWLAVIQWSAHMMQGGV